MNELEVMMTATALEVLETRLGEACLIGCPLCGGLVREVSFDWDSINLQCENRHFVRSGDM